MSEQARALFEQAMQLPFPEREQLANQLMRSVEEGMLTEAEADALDKEWAPEIRRRIAEIEGGAVQCIPWADVDAEMRKLLSE